MGKDPGFSERTNEYPSPQEFAVYLLDFVKQYGPFFQGGLNMHCVLFAV
jgi:hypothetical protein